MVLGQFGYGAAVQAVEASQREPSTTPATTTMTASTTASNTGATANEAEKLPASSPASTAPPPSYVSSTINFLQQPHTLITGVTGRVHLVQLHEAAYAPPEYRVAIANVVDHDENGNDTYGTFLRNQMTDVEQQRPRRQQLMLMHVHDRSGGLYAKGKLEILVENMWWIIGMFGFMVVLTYYYGFRRISLKQPKGT